MMRFPNYVQDQIGVGYLAALSGGVGTEGWGNHRQGFGPPCDESISQMIFNTESRIS